MSAEGNGFQEWAPRLIATYSSVLEAESAIYCSTPITSGRRYVDWLIQNNLDFASIDAAPNSLREDHHRLVVEENIRHAAIVAQRLRRLQHRPVINPAAVPHVGGWRQTEWLTLWEEVIDRFSHSVMFVDGWEYSLGCTHEYAHAMQLGRPCTDENLNELSVGQGVEMIDEACETISQLGGNSATLRRNLQMVIALLPAK